MRTTSLSSWPASASDFGGERVEDDADRRLAVTVAAADGEDLAGDRLGRLDQLDPGGRWRAASRGYAVIPASPHAASGVALAGTAVIAVPHGLGFGAAALIVLASAVVLGVAPSAVGFVLWAYAMSGMDVGRVTLSLYLVPAAAIVISLAWLAQIPGPVELAGGAVALCGVILVSTSKPGARKPVPPAARPPADPCRVLLGDGPGVVGWGDANGCTTDQGLAGIRAPG
ncbi:MAG: EamA family transporter [Streptosporangiaceae bacterium]